MRRRSPAAGLLPPHQVCRLIGHRREGYNAGWIYDRQGRRRSRWHQRCARCGTTDGGEVFRDGVLEPLRAWRLGWAWLRLRYAARRWWRADCDECRRPMTRCGCTVGDHRRCDPIPF